MHLTARTDVLDARKKRNDSSVYWVSVNESSDVVLDLKKNWRVKIFFVSIPPKSNAISTYTEKTLA